MLPIFFKTLTCIRAINFTLFFSALATELPIQIITHAIKEATVASANVLHRGPCSPIPHKKPQLRCWRRPLMVRHPYSEAVKSNEEERFPLFP